EEEYNKQLINAFKFGDTPEILIVVSKLLTGFDAPRNVVLYLTRKFGDEHTLLQAIARVNRVYACKDFGYVIDYAGVLHSLSEALDLYSSLAGFEPDELDGTIVDVWEEVKKLPQRYSELRDVFKSVPNKRDQEAYERLLADEAIRDDFYRCLGAYARTLTVALGSVRFLEESAEEKVRKYKEDLRFFEALRRSVRRRYAETIDFGEYEPKIQRLLDRHVGTGEVEVITPLVDIFDRDAFAREVDAATTPASKADMIASRTAKTIRERMDDDPAFYRRFSELLEQAIADWRAQRMSDVEYLGLTTHIRDAVTNREQESLPPSVQYDPMKRAVFGLVRETASRYSADSETVAKVSEEAALSIDAAIDERRVVNWTESTDVQNRMRTAVEDLLFEMKARHGLDISLDDIDNVMEQSIRLAVRHEAR
ncbi:MAG: type I restriction enzyme subunit R domain-containing protein, partial [Acidimicrobiales bacterium]